MLSFELSVLSDEISQDFGRAGEVAVSQFGMCRIELRTYGTRTSSHWIRMRSLKPFGFHNLGHSLATFFMDEQENPAVVQAIMRHAKMGMNALQ